MLKPQDNTFPPPDKAWYEYPAELRTYTLVAQSSVVLYLAEFTTPEDTLAALTAVSDMMDDLRQNLNPFRVISREGEIAVKQEHADGLRRIVHHVSSMVGVEEFTRAYASALAALQLAYGHQARTDIVELYKAPYMALVLLSASWDDDGLNTLAQMVKETAKSGQNPGTTFVPN